MELPMERSLPTHPERRHTRSAIVLTAATGVAILAMVATSAHGYVTSQQEAQAKQEALERTAQTAVRSASLDGLRTMPPASRARAVLSTERVATDFRTVTKNTRTLLKGNSKVVQQGQQGLLLRRWQVIAVEGQAAGRELVSERVIREPIDRIVHVGIAVPAPPTPAATPSARESLSGGSTTTLTPRTTSTPVSRDTRSSWPAVAGAENLNWAAVARCESSGNPLAVNPAGPYYGLYQFLPATWRSVGGSGLPTAASPAEQTYRAKLLWARSGPGQWPTCGKLL
jgi:resuscitation-promoting factor RpfB